MSLTDRLYRRVQMMIAPVKITATDDTGPVHRAQVRATAPETIDNVAVLQLYGVTSHAPVGSDAMAIFVGGDRSNAVIVATGNQKLRVRSTKSGESGLYDGAGTVVALTNDGNIAITCTGTVTINAPTVAIAGASGGKAVINLTGDIHATGTITADTILAPKGHVGP